MPRVKKPKEPRDYDSLTEEDFDRLGWFADIITQKLTIHMTKWKGRYGSTPKSTMRDRRIIDWNGHMRIMEVTGIHPSKLTSHKKLKRSEDIERYITLKKIQRQVLPKALVGNEFDDACKKISSIMGVGTAVEQKRKKKEAELVAQQKILKPSKKKSQTKSGLRNEAEKAVSRHSEGVQDELFSTRQMAGGAIETPVAILPPQTSIEERHEYQRGVNLIFPEIDWEAKNQQELNAHKYPKPKRFGRKRRVCR